MEEYKETKVSSDETMKRLMTLVADVKARDPHQPEFLQAFEEVGRSLLPLFAQRPELLDVLRVMEEPERMIMFRVSWIDDQGKQHVNRGFRVQYSSALGPYKGGLRFHPTVNLSVVKFLGFEQVLKNALSGLPMGGGKGGSDFNPKGRSNREIYSFCCSFMTELQRHIGQFTDVPAGDIGVGAREIGYLYGQYTLVRNTHGTGVLTGKGTTWGGSNIRPEATGYGVVYIANHVARANAKLMKIDAAKAIDNTLSGLGVLVSGSGNVAQFCAQKLIQIGAKVLTMSDSSGFIYEPNGISEEGLNYIMKLKNIQRGRIDVYTKFSKTAKFFAGEKPWNTSAAHVAMPCATQNEISATDAKALVKNGVLLVVEGANMPSTNEAIEVFKQNKVLFVPAKAANVGGVAVSGLEMTQNSERLSWTREEVDKKLQEIMKSVFNQMSETAEKVGFPGDYQLGANCAGFLKVAEAMLEQGRVLSSSIV